MKKLHIAVLALAVGLAFTSCSSVEDLGRFTVISSKNVDLSRLGEMGRSSERTKTDKFNAKFLFIRTKKISDNYILENALDNALEKIPGAVAMVDVKLQYYKKIGFLHFTKKWGYVFDGIALVDPKLASEAGTPNEDNTIFVISDGTDSNIAFVSEKEYNAILAKMTKL